MTRMVRIAAAYFRGAAWQSEAAAPSRDAGSGSSAANPSVPLKAKYGPLGSPMQSFSEAKRCTVRAG